MNRSTFYRLWHQLATRAGLSEPLRHPHVAKHTAGTLLAAGNTNAFLIRQRLGHRALKSAAIYCQGITDEQAAQAARSVFAQAF